MRRAIREMLAYQPPIEGRSVEDSRLLVDFNERTTPVPDFIIAAVSEYLMSRRLHLYPEYKNIEERIAEYAGVKSNEVMITNGSDHGIEIIYRATTEPGDDVVVPSPTFAMLTHCAEVQGTTILSPFYSKRGGYPIDEVLSAITDKTKLVVCCNPNSPTGTISAVSTIERILTEAPHVSVLVDECYFEYSSVTAKDLIKDYNQIFITRTFSKTWGLAALRLGYVLAHSDTISNLKKVRGPYDMNVPAVIAANAALENPSYMKEYVDEVITLARPRFCAYLETKGINYWPSEANFVLLEPKNPVSFEEGLRSRGIYVRSRKGPGIEGTVRITIGKLDDVERVISALEEML
jgi:histidinol-phosphate aminotransferase